MLPIYLFIIVSVVFGGGPGKLDLGFVIWTFSALLLIITCAWQGWFTSFQSLPVTIRLGAALWVGLTLVQLIPLPPGLWHSLPGSDLRLQIMGHFGFADNWLPLSLNPLDTTYTAIVSLGMLAFFMAVIQLSAQHIRYVCWAITAMVAVATVVGVIQYTSSGQTLQFHSFAHRSSLIGFFANKNHMGLMLACMIPIGHALLQTLRGHENFKNYQIGSLIVLILTLEIATNSRAGLGLAALAAILTIAKTAPKRRAVLFAGAAGIALVMTALVAFVPTVSSVFERFGSTAEDGRLTILTQAWPLLEQYYLLGSGFGSFSDVFNPTEKLEWLTPNYVNHLHNDWLQLIVEGGLPAIVSAILVIRAVITSARRYRDGSTPGLSSNKFEQNLVWAGLLIILLFGLHSFVDYPARRIASLMLLIFAFALAFRPFVLERQKISGDKMS